MRIRRRQAKSQEITGFFCTTCQTVCSVEQGETHAETVTLTLTCGHTVVLLPGDVGGLRVHGDQIIVYPNRNDLPKGVV